MRLRNNRSTSLESAMINKIPQTIRSYLTLSALMDVNPGVLVAAYTVVKFKAHLSKPVKMYAITSKVLTQTFFRRARLKIKLLSEQLSQVMDAHTVP